MERAPRFAARIGDTKGAQAGSVAHPDSACTRQWLVRLGTIADGPAARQQDEDGRDASNRDKSRERMNGAQALHSAGQSLWLDSISRTMLRSGALSRYVSEFAVTGLTSNPTILGHAMAASEDYDASLRRAVSEGVTDPQDIVFVVALEDLRKAADLFRPTWEATGGRDGYVSVEVPPDLAYEATATAALALPPARPGGFAELVGQDPRYSAWTDRYGRSRGRWRRGQHDPIVLRHPLPSERGGLPAGLRAPTCRRPSARHPLGRCRFSSRAGTLRPTRCYLGSCTASSGWR